MSKAGLVTSGGKLVYETKYDKASKEFACLVDIPFMKDSKVYTHYYFGFSGNVEAPNVIITNTDSIEFSSYRVDSFWAKNWKH